MLDQNLKLKIEYLTEYYSLFSISNSSILYLGLCLDSIYDLPIYSPMTPILDNIHPLQNHIDRTKEDHPGSTSKQK